MSYRRETEEPAVIKTKGAGNMDEETVTHPAFAQIGASRVSGFTPLYGSDFLHNAFMTVTISTSQLRRSLSNDWHYAPNEIIEVAMTEAQWATFVSSPNVGSGVPCTLQHIQGKRVPGLPDPPERSSQFGREARETMDDALTALKELMDKIDGLGLSKAKADTLKNSVRTAHMQISSNIPFVAKQFDEHMEATVEKAKAEVHGYMTGALMRSGLDALANGPPPLQLEAPKDPA